MSMDGYRVSLWSSEIFAVLSMVPCFLMTYFSEKFQAYIYMVYVEGWRHVQSTPSVLTVSELLFTLTLISLLVGVYSNLKLGSNILIVKRILFFTPLRLASAYNTWDTRFRNFSSLPTKD